jgi:Protein of unknown function (DUF2924)
MTEPLSISALSAMDRPALAKHWAQAFGCRAPLSCQATLLRCALAWHLQSAVSKREVERVEASVRQAASAPLADSLSPGTRLLREWQGQTHHVTVLNRPGFCGGSTL